MKKVFLFLTATVFGFASMANGGWTHEKSEGAQTIKLLYNEYGDGDNGYGEKSYTWQGGNTKIIGDAVETAIGDDVDAWVIAKGQQFSLTVKGTCNATGVFKTGIVDEQAGAGYWFENSAFASPEVNVVAGEEFEATFVYTITALASENFEAVGRDAPALILGLAMADWDAACAFNGGTPMYEDVSGVKKVEFNFSEFKFEYLGDLSWYTKPYAMTNNGPDVDGKTKYQVIIDLAYDAQATTSDFFNFSIKGIATQDIDSLMIALWDGSGNAQPKPYATSLCEEDGEGMATIIANIKKGETFEVKGSLPIVIDVDHYDLRYEVVFMAKSQFEGAQIILDLNDADSFEIGADKGYGIPEGNSNYNVYGNFVFTLNNGEVAVTGKSNSVTGDLEIPSEVTIGGESYPVTSIADYAFFGCTGLTSITIPNSVTSIGYNAFEGCNNLTSITIPDNLDVSSLDLYLTKDGIRYKILNGKEVEVSSSYHKEEYYDEDCPECSHYHYISDYSGDIVIPTSITAGNTFSVTSIGYGAFENSSGLTSITIPNSVTNIGAYAFYGCNNLTSVTLNGDVDVSEAGLSIVKDGVTYSVLNKNSVALQGYGHYSTDDDWIMNENAGEFIIPTSIVAGNTFMVRRIGEESFYECKLTSVVIPESVTNIEDYAFYGCTKLTKVTCLSTTPPDAYSHSFENYNGYLYIPCDNFDDYDMDACWGTFRHKECIGATTVDLQKDEVTVEPEKTEAVFSMPTNESANSYTLTISNNGVVFCTLTFNAQGQLANIDFSTTKSYELKAGVSAYQFTVTGLSEATDYGYSFKALASNKAVLKEYTGSFTTKNEDGTGGSSQGGAEVEGGSGQGGEGGEQGGSTAINGVSNATTVAIVGNQILVNDEAPAFVVTVSGKKIANQNLKSGVYFVNVEGETVKVSVQ